MTKVNYSYSSIISELYGLC